MLKNLLFIFPFILLGEITLAQDLNCKVQVLSPKIQATDKHVFKTLENALIEFMNNRKWSPDVFQVQERIECTIIITINQWDGDQNYEASAQVQLSRPVYASNYNSTILNLNDKDFNFQYAESQSLEFSESSNLSNLTSMLAFYAYTLMGLDYDTFSLEGGTPFYQKAQTIVNNAQNANDKGWKAFEDTKNRYWLVENLLNSGFKPLRQVYYQYHRKGMDQLYQKPDEGRTQIATCLPLLQRIYRDKPGSMILAQFLTAKADEMVNVFSKANTADKPKIVEMLSEMDAANINKYRTILTN